MRVFPGDSLRSFLLVHQSQVDEKNFVSFRQNVRAWRKKRRARRAEYWTNTRAGTLNKTHGKIFVDERYAFSYRVLDATTGRRFSARNVTSVRAVLGLFAPYKRVRETIASYRHRGTYDGRVCGDRYEYGPAERRTCRI